MDVVTLGAALKGAKSYTDSAIAPLMGGVHYKGSVLYFSDLPSNPEEGDGYTVKYAGTSGTVLDGTEYVWGYDNDASAYAWIDFGKDCYTKAQTDNLLSGKIAPTDYATQNTGGTIKAWTTTADSITTLHIATE